MRSNVSVSYSWSWYHYSMAHFSDMFQTNIPKRFYNGYMCVTQTPTHTHIQLFSETKIRTEEALQNQFVLVPDDKASNNVAITCKPYHVEVWDGNKSYCEVNKSSDESVDENKEYAKCLSYTVPEKEKTLPIIYWISIIH